MIQSKFISIFLAWWCIACSGGIPQQVPDLGENTEVAKPVEEKVDSVAISYLLGKFDPATDSHFVKLSAPYAGGSALNQYLHREALDAFLKMREAALQEGITLQILSGTRNFAYQKSIWESKWNGARLQGGVNLAQTLPDPQARALEILKYSSMPGTSRHHWGTDMDLNAFNNAYFEEGAGKQLYQWLVQHAATYGFCQPYTDKSLEGRTGYEEEKWHWSYTPLAKKYLAAYQAYISHSELGGFEGGAVATEISVIPNYVLGVNSACK